MESGYLFGLLNTQRGWLSARQAFVTQNIANASTPAYKAIDVLPFSTVLDEAALQVTGDNPLHLHPASQLSSNVVSKESDTWETAHSGNNVTLEAELIKQGEVRSAFSLDSNILKAFHGMWLQSLRG